MRIKTDKVILGRRKVNFKDDRIAYREIDYKKAVCISRVEYNKLDFDYIKKQFSSIDVRGNKIYLTPRESC